MAGHIGILGDLGRDKMTTTQVDRILAGLKPMQFEVTVYKPFPIRGALGSDVRGMAATNVPVVSLESLRTALYMMEAGDE